MSDTANQPDTPAPGARRRRLIIGGITVAAVLAGAIGVGRAVADRDDHHRAGWNMEHGLPAVLIEHRADRLLGKVDATADQQAQVHAIIEAAVTDLAPIRTSMLGTREQLVALLTAPQIDPAAVETLRAERQTDMDRITQRASKALEDAAAVLTPDQRLKLRSVLTHEDRPEPN